MKWSNDRKGKNFLHFMSFIPYIDNDWFIIIQQQMYSLVFLQFYVI